MRAWQDERKKKKLKPLDERGRSGQSQPRQDFVHSQKLAAEANMSKHVSMRRLSCFHHPNILHQNYIQSMMEPMRMRLAIQNDDATPNISILRTTATRTRC
jgi:hypothetical protein